MGDAATNRPGVSGRVLGLLHYLGLAPVLAAFRRVRADPFVRHHRAWALAVLLLLQAGVVLYFVGELTVARIWPSLVRALAGVPWLWWVLPAAWGLVWLVC